MRLASRTSKLSLLIVLFLGALLRIERVGSDPLWHDEILSVVRVAGGNKTTFLNIARVNQPLTGSSLHGIINSSLKGPERGYVHMPAFYLLSRVSHSAFGDSALSVKMLPLACGIILPLAVAFLTYRITANPISPLVAALLVALNPSLIAYSVEGRAYSLLVLLIVVYLYLLLSPLSSRRSWILLLVTFFGAFTHLFFLPIAWLSFLLKWFMATSNRGECKRTASILIVASMAALAVIIPVLRTTDASNHFTSQTTTTGALVLGADATIEDLLGIKLPEVPYCGLGLVLLMIFLSLRQKSAGIRIALWSMVVPFLVLLGSDLLVGGLRSTVPRYSLTLPIAFSLTLAIVIGEIWQRNRIIAVASMLGIVGATLLAPSSIEQHLKGGRYEELAWYTATYRNQDCLILSTLPGNRSVEFAANSSKGSVIIPVSEALPGAALSRVQTAWDTGTPVLTLSSMDGIQPGVPGRNVRWKEEFVGAQTVVYRLVSRESGT